LGQQIVTLKAQPFNISDFAAGEHNSATTSTKEMYAVEQR